VTIETKYEIGDRHFFIESNAVQESTIIEVIGRVTDCGAAESYTKIEYKVSGGKYVDEDRICPTKQELLNSL